MRSCCPRRATERSSGRSIHGFSVSLWSGALRPVEGGWVDRVVGLEGDRAEIAMLETPDGHTRLELTKFHPPSGRGGDRHAAANAPGIRHVAFAVDEIDAVVASLRAHGAELFGEVERYEDSYRLCYVRGPEGVIVELAEQIG